jgi:hypothetical protein
MIDNLSINIIAFNGSNFDLFINYLNGQKDEKGKSLRESA